MYMKNMWDVGRGEQHECDGGVGQGGPRGQHDYQEGGGPTDGQGRDGRKSALASHMFYSYPHSGFHTCSRHFYTHAYTYNTHDYIHVYSLMYMIFLHLCI